MNTKLYVGNLSYDITQNDLQDLFSPHGTVTEVHLPLDRDTGRPRGFAFVSMATPEGAQAAIDALNGQNQAGRNLTVNEARPREDRPEGGFGSGRGPRRGSYAGRR
jgi:cold-inducible RNA-binding protein